MMVIDGLGVDNPEVDMGAPEEVGRTRYSQRGHYRIGQTAPNPGSAVSNCVTLGKSLNLTGTISASRIGAVNTSRG